MHLKQSFLGLKAYLGEGIQDGSNGNEMNRNHGKGSGGRRASGKKTFPNPLFSFSLNQSGSKTAVKGGMNRVVFSKSPVLKTTVSFLFRIQLPINPVINEKRRA
jgi:hypothetical protein